MKNIKITYLVLIVALTVLWLLADTLLAADYEFFALRASLVNYTGIIGMAAMSVGMMLAVRPVLVEPYLAASTRCIGYTSGWASPAWHSPSSTGCGRKGRNG